MATRRKPPARRLHQFKAGIPKSKRAIVTTAAMGRTLNQLSVTIAALTDDFQAYVKKLEAQGFVLTLGKRGFHVKHAPGKGGYPKRGGVRAKKRPVRRR